MSNIFIKHTRALGYCRKGVKRFLEERGFDWKTFLSKGIPEEEFKKVDDTMVIDTINFMRKGTNVGR